MRIGLVQVGMDRWNTEELARLVAEASRSGVDLAIFPETFPWSSERAEHALSKRDVELRLARAIDGLPIGVAVGAHVRSDATRGKMHNCLVFSRGTTFEWYSKRRTCDDPTVEERDVEEGPNQQKCIGSADFSFAPFICADVYGRKTGSPPAEAELADEFRQYGGCEAAKLCIVTAFAGSGPVARRQWERQLSLLTNVSDLPVAFCNPSGEDPYGDVVFGGGGSGLFWPGKQVELDVRPRDAGLVIVEVDSEVKSVVREEFRPFDR